MLDTAEWVQNVLASCVILVILLVSGWPLARLARSTSGAGAWPLYSLASCSAVIYLLPFRGGLILGAVMSVLGCIILVATDYRRILQAAGQLLQSSVFWIAVVLWLSLQSVLMVNRVPIGMDATMHTVSARLLAEHGGLSRNHAPFAPELPSCTVNFGLSSVAAIAVLCGCRPEAALLACTAWAYFVYALGLHAILKSLVTSWAAMLLAVFGLISSRGLQETLCWGGFPMAAGLGLGLFSIAELLSAILRPHWRKSIGVGVLLAGIPLVHGIAAGLWLYTAGPALLLLALFHRRQWASVWHVVRITVPAAATIVMVYLLVGQGQLDRESRSWIFDYQQSFAPQGHGWTLWLNSIKTLERWAGTEPFALWVAATMGLLLLRRWQAVALQLTVGIMLVVLEANSRVWWLPLSETLYPERVAYCLNALVPLSLAAFWHGLPAWSKAYRTGWALVPVVLVLAAFVYYKDRYQRTALQMTKPPDGIHPVSFPLVSADDYAALRWCEIHLNPATTLVEGQYNTAAAYLPSVAGIACTGWHIHCLIIPQFQKMMRERRVTHRWITITAEQPAPADAIFFNRTVAIVPAAPE